MSEYLVQCLRRFNVCQTSATLRDRHFVNVLIGKRRRFAVGSPNGSSLSESYLEKLPVKLKSPAEMCRLVG